MASAGKQSARKSGFIELRGARTHNLQNIDLRLPIGALTMITGVSGSGKSSLAFDTLHAESQRRYISSLSPYIRQFFSQEQKAEFDSISGLAPSIAISQKKNRSAKGDLATVSEIYRQLQIIYGNISIAYDKKSGKALQSYSPGDVASELEKLPRNSRIMLAAQIFDPSKSNKKTDFAKALRALEEARRQGFVRLGVEDKICELDEYLAEIKQVKSVSTKLSIIIDRLKIKDGIASRIIDACEIAYRISDGFLELWVDENGVWQKRIFSSRYYDTRADKTLPKLKPEIFALTRIENLCKKCRGEGETLTVNDVKILHTCGELSLLELCDSFLKRLLRQKNIREQRVLLLEKIESYEVDLRLVLKKAPKRLREFLLARLAKFARVRLQNATGKKDKFLLKFCEREICASCAGAKLRADILTFKLDFGDKFLNIADFCHLNPSRALQALDNLCVPETYQKILADVLQELRDRLNFLIEIGMDYVSLNRKISTLSGGELQRTYLAAQLSARLSGVMYIIDEPCRGLHPHDRKLLLRCLLSLRDAGNTLVVVEHDLDSLHIADWLIDLGPGAGSRGGELMAMGRAQDALKSSSGATADFFKKRADKSKEFFQIEEIVESDAVVCVQGACANNLKNVNVKIPIYRLVGVSGVSGSGKSSLMIDTVARALRKMQVSRSRENKEKTSASETRVWLEGNANLHKISVVDQASIAKQTSSARSCVATYIGLMPALRRLFASSSLAKARGYGHERFSFNKRGGRCETCEGLGELLVDLRYLPNARRVCETCNGARYNLETLDVKFRGKNIAETLAFSAEEALDFFKNHGKLARDLEPLCRVGLSYLTLGQNAGSLSGGESQRLKLARAMRTMTKNQLLHIDGGNFYIFDEPSAGLHVNDIERLLQCFRDLRSAGDTVVVIDHNLSLLAGVDFLIDIGPGAGEKGGEVLASGKPLDLLANISQYPRSATLEFLADFFKSI